MCIKLKYRLIARCVKNFQELLCKMGNVPSEATEVQSHRHEKPIINSYQGLI